MDDIISRISNVNLDDYHIIENDLKHLAMAFTNGELESVSFPPIDEEYPFHLARNSHVLFKMMKNILPFEHDVDIISLVNFYIDLVLKSEEF